MDNSIQRHKTAITRYDLSKPISMALQYNVIKKEHSIFDYGCGKGHDVNELKDKGYNITGWDPVYSSENEIEKSDIVNLGYVINVIEKPYERDSVLLHAFNTAEKCLIVSAQVLPDGKKAQGTPFSDGILTQKKTFQKYYTQQELKQYLHQTLKVEPVAASPGIFYLFKDSSLKEEYLSSKYLRSYMAHTRERVPIEEKLKPYKGILEEFANLVGQIGRMPKPDEVPFYDEIIAKVGKLKRCISYCETLFDNFIFEDIQRNRRDDLLVFLALSNFSGSLKCKHLPTSLQRDIKGIFGSYKAGLETATDLLFAVGKPDIISQACVKSKIGKLLPDALYVHTDYINSLSPILRIFVGCGTVFAGDFPDATLVKINRMKSKFSYLYYDNFDEDPHPALSKAVILDLAGLKMKEWEYSSGDNRPILHRKETFVGMDYPLYEQFAELTKREEDAGLLDDKKNIGREKEWKNKTKNHYIMDELVQ